MGLFQIVALPSAPFVGLFDAPAAELRAAGARLMVADAEPGFPCRVSLEDAKVGETVLLLPHAHHDVDSPYRASGPVFVRRHAREARLNPGQVPPMLRHRLLSVRAYDADAMMVGADVVEGIHLEQCLEKLLGDPAAEYLHVHNARPGCYTCRVIRA